MSIKGLPLNRNSLTLEKQGLMTKLKRVQRPKAQLMLPPQMKWSIIMKKIWIALGAILCLSVCRCNIFRQSSSSELRTISTTRIAFFAPWEKPEFQPGPDSESFIFKNPCPDVPPVQRDLDVPLFYSDKSNSIINPELKARYDTSNRSIFVFKKGLSKIANAALYKRSDAAASCATRWLAVWSQREALLGKMANNSADKQTLMQGGFVRKWALASITLSYLKIRSFKSVQESAYNSTILDWISHLEQSVFNDVKNYGPTSAKNNHIYWAALARMLAGIALGNPQTVQWSVDIYRQAMDQIQENGTLPLELKRRSMALHYHYFAITPLLLIAKFAKANGIDLYRENEQRMNKLLNLLLPTLENPDTFSTISGFPVNHDLHESYTWVELMQALKPTPESNKFLKAHRPIYDTDLGDNVTALWGVNIN